MSILLPTSLIDLLHYVMFVALNYMPYPPPGIRPGTPPDLRHWPAMVSPFCNKTLRNYSDSRHPDCEGVSFSMLQKGIQERFQFMVMLLPKPLYIGIDFSCCSRGFLVISISKPAFDTERSQFGSCEGEDGSWALYVSQRMAISTWKTPH
ncbi:hypothetical protein TEA_013302 [Camellia sinensis var. sinensis]|uniref:Uncharacterized protein n=1 Tax=Camellia sinensis var. sinensis TaxID=542762 RepID=A0A4V3WLC4_CAMSN|nr:hypothetical protein TEA_013302 [Camellia sinensis var. sinensis]